MSERFSKKPLKYLVTSAVGGLTSIYHSGLILRSIDGEIPYETYWGTLGTDYFGIIGQIALGQYALRMFNKEGLEKVVNYAIPLGWATLHTALESMDLIGIENMNTKGGFDPLDITCYWGGALTMSLLAKLYDRKKRTPDSLII